MINMSYTDFALALFSVMFVPIVMLWIHIKLEENVTNEKTKYVLTWIAPVTVYVIPLTVLYFYFSKGM